MLRAAVQRVKEPLWGPLVISARKKERIFGQDNRMDRMRERSGWHLPGAAASGLL
jgi:hypothetical protein